MYFLQQPNEILDISSSHTILRIKTIGPSCVLELQGVDGHTTQDHSKNYVSCHLPNLNPTIITLTWIPPLDYPCQVCQRIDNADQMLLYNNCNGGYHLFCLKSKLIQVFINIWYYSSCFLASLSFIFRPCHIFPGSSLGGGYMRISSLIFTQTMSHFFRLRFKGGYMRISS